MAPGSDWLANIFLIIFLFGLVFTVTSLLLGGTHLGGVAHHGGIHVGGHHVSAGSHVGGHAGHASGHAVGHSADQHVGIGHAADIHVGGHHSSEGDSIGHDGPGFLNMPTILAFLTWFGGVGYIVRHSLSFGPFMAVSTAVMSGLVGGGIMFVLLARVLWPMMSKPLIRSDYHLPGTAARVVSPIREGGVGEIVYTKNGSRFTTGARSVDEQAVAKGVEVVILRYERGIAYIQPVEDILSRRLEEAKSA